MRWNASLNRSANRSIPGAKTSETLSGVKAQIADAKSFGPRADRFLELAPDHADGPRARARLAELGK